MDITFSLPSFVYPCTNFFYLLMRLVTDFLKQFVPLQASEIEYINLHLKSDSAKAGEYIVKQGEVCRKMIFLQEGICVMVYEKGGRAFIRDFIFENNMASVYESFLMGEPAPYSLKAITPSSYVYISQKVSQDLVAKIPVLKNFEMMMTQHIYLNMSRRFESIITLSAEERYEELVNNRPRLLLEVPQYMLASYLGITNVALSRIRKRVSDK
ncbi:MAG: Crp/Fnr family transcriptional regulator [Bacteroidota bacterium]